MRLLLRFLISGAATWLAVWLLPGLSFSTADTQSQILQALVIAAIFGAVNIFVKPVIQFLSGCLLLLTLGLFSIVINAMMLLLTAWISEKLGPEWQLHVDGFWWAALAAIIIAVVTELGDRLLTRTGKRSAN